MRCGCAQCLSTLWLGAGTFRRGSISRDSWRDLFVQTRADNATFLADTFARLVPEPRGPCLQHLNMDKFFATPKLKVYIIEARALAGHVAGLPFCLQRRDLYTVFAAPSRRCELQGAWRFCSHHVHVAQTLRPAIAGPGHQHLRVGDGQPVVHVRGAPEAGRQRRRRRAAAAAACGPGRPPGSTPWLT